MNSAIGFPFGYSLSNTCRPHTVGVRINTSKLKPEDSIQEANCPTRFQLCFEIFADQSSKSKEGFLL